VNPREFCRERGFTAAILLTYKFDALFFERVALQELWAGNTGDVLVLADAEQLTQSVQSWQRQLQHLGRRYQLVPSNTPGRFHPKIMLRLGRSGGAVWIGSGNQTFGGWGGNRELCSAWMFGPGQRDSGRWMPRLLERIQSWGPLGLQYDILKRIAELPWLQSMASEQELGAQTILTSYDRLPLASQLQRRWSGRRFTQVRVFTGSTDEDGAFLARLNEDFGIESSFIILDEGRASFRATQLRKLPLATRVMTLPTPSMHAKFYWFDGPDGPAAVMGSANCSAAAWLLPPTGGGSIEAVAVYDQPQTDQFAGVLELFESESLIEAQLAEHKAIPTVNERGVSAPTISELSWDSALGEIRVRFNASGHEISKVSMEFEDLIVELTSFSRSLWRAEIPEIAARLETVFVKVQIELAGGASFSCYHWLNNLVELHHAARGRHIADVLNSLPKQSTSGEQQKIIADLQRISLLLLSEPDSFPDPLINSAPPKSETETVTEEDVKPINPEEFIRSIYDPDFQEESRKAGRQNMTLSLMGVMRALFPPEEVIDLEDEIDFVDEPGEGENNKKKPREKKIKESSTAPGLQYRQRLRDDVNLFIQRLAKPDFAETCTATQLVQACAYPIAVVVLGSEGNWIDREDAVGWANRIFDVLFIPRQKEPGLLEKVRLRYKGEGQEKAFSTIVGDGTFWVALLNAFSMIPLGIPKALALRSLFQTELLLANTNRSRIETLLGKLNREDAATILRQAVDVSNSLSGLEQKLAADYENAKSSQEEKHIAYDVGDLLWHPRAGWAESKETDTWGSNINVHLHLRARTTLVSSKVYVNVTKNPNYRSEINNILKLMMTIPNSVLSEESKVDSKER
jgi:hypothetical protein